jgi:hypothetical protein
MRIFSTKLNLSLLVYGLKCIEIIFMCEDHNKADREVADGMKIE